MTTNNYTPGLNDPGPQGDDREGCTGIVMNAIMLALGAMAMCAVMVTNVVNRRRHVVVTARTHDYAVAVMVAVAILVLLYMPVGAQNTGGATSNTLYMPEIAWRFPSWFTDAELTEAMERDGYDPDVASMHTNCYLDASATPPHDIRYSSCEQYYVDGVPTEGTQHYIWWLRMGNGIVTGVEVGGTMVQASGTDAPCYVDNDQEVTCG